jgi:hypothetical protein
LGGTPALDDVGDRVEATGDRLLQQVQGFADIRVNEIATGHEPLLAEDRCGMRRWY